MMKLLPLLLFLIIGVNSQDPINTNYTKVLNNGTGVGSTSLSYRSDAVAFCHGDSFHVVNEPLTTMGTDIDSYTMSGHPNSTCSATTTHLFRANDTDMLVMTRNTEVVEAFRFGDGLGFHSMSEVDEDGERVAVCMSNGTVMVFRGSENWIQVDNNVTCRHAAFTKDTNGVKTLAISTEGDGRLEFWVEDGDNDYSLHSVVVNDYDGPYDMVLSNNQGMVVAQSDGVLGRIKHANSAWTETVAQGVGDVVSWCVGKNDTSMMTFTFFMDPGLELNIFEDGQQLLSPVDERITAITKIASHSRDEAYLLDQSNNLYRYGADLPPEPTPLPTTSPTQSPTHSPTHSPTRSPTTASPTASPTAASPTDLPLIIGLSAGGLVLSIGVVYLFLHKGPYSRI